MSDTENSYEIQETEKGLEIIERESKTRLISRSIAYDESEELDIDIKSLLADYITKNPSYGEKLRFETKTPGFCVVTDGKHEFDEFNLKDMKVNIADKSAYLGVINYSDIAKQTREHEYAVEETLEDRSTGLTDAYYDLRKNGLRKFTNNYPKVIFGAMLGCAILGYSAASCVQTTDGDAVDLEIMNTPKLFANKLNGYTFMIDNFESTYKRNQFSANINLEDFLAFTNKIDETRLGENQIKRINNLITRAKNIKKDETINSIVEKLELLEESN